MWTCKPTIYSRITLMGLYMHGNLMWVFWVSLLQKCHLHSVSDGGGAITAQRRESPAEDTGFTFLGCTVTGVKTAVLGRPWGQYSRVVFAFSYISSAILPQGWDDWGDSSKQRYLPFLLIC